MNSKSIVLIGLLASILLIFLCVYFNAERYYNELEGNKSKDNLVLDNANISIEKSKQVPINQKEDTSIPKFADEEVVLEKPIQEELGDKIEEEEIIKEETSSFSYRIEGNQKYISGELPLLENGDSFKTFIANCTIENSCDNRVTFLDNSETLSWKSLIVSVIGLFDKVGMDNGKILVDKDAIKIEGIFKDQETKNHLSSVLVSYKSSHKMYDMTTIAIEEKPTFTLVKDNIEEVQEKVSKLLKDKQIHFEKNSGKITIEGKKVLDKLVLILENPDTILLEVQGHTDVGGTKKINLAISQMRASTVKKYLMKKGLKKENITVKGFGETKLLLPKTPYNILNRRVEIYLKRK